MNELALPGRPLRTMHLFAGAGGGLLADILLGHVPVCAVEIDSYCRSVLLARQREGYLPRFPIWDDVRTFDGRPWRGHVDCISGGFPCQDISSAGKRAGIWGGRSGLWKEFARIIREVGPRFLFVENSADICNRGLGCVLGDMAAMGFDARWGVFSACRVGASHTRARVFIMADADGIDGEARLANWVGQANDNGSQESRRRGRQEHARGYFTVRMEAGAEGNRAPDDVAYRVDRLRAIGNGQVPAVAALAWRTLSK